MTIFVGALAVVVGLLLLVAAGADLVFLSDASHPLGERLRAWASRYTLYAAGVATMAGALLGHFFWQ